MTFRDPRFERSVRRRVRAAIRQSPALRKELRRVRHNPRTDISQAVLRALITAALVVALHKLGSSGATVAALLSLLTIWSTCFAIHYANRLRYQLYAAPQLLVLALQPVRDDAIFAHQWRAFTQLTLWLLVDAVGALSMIFWFAGANTVQWLTALPCALALWMSAISVAALFVRLRPAANFASISSGLFLLTMTVAIAAFYKPDVVARLLDGASSPFFLVPPFGWLAYVIHEAVLGPALVPLLLLAPIALLAPGLHHARKRLAAHYQFFVSEGPEPEESAGAEPPPLVASDSESSPILSPATPMDPELVASIAKAWGERSREWTEHGILERWVSRFLTMREHDIAEFMTAGATDWTLALRRSSILVLAALLAAFTLGPTGLWICYVGLYFAASTGVPILGTRFVGLSLVNVSGASFPAYAGLPIGYHELGRFITKVGVIRTLAFAPVALLAGGIVGHFAVTWTLGLFIAAKIVAIIVCWQPVIVTLQLSSPWRALKVIAILGPLIVALLAVTAGILLGPLPVAAGCWPVGAFLSWLIFRLYGRLYHRNLFDLMHGEAQ